MEKVKIEISKKAYEILKKTVNKEQKWGEFKNQKDWWDVYTGGRED